MEWQFLKDNFVVPIAGWIFNMKFLSGAIGGGLTVYFTKAIEWHFKQKDIKYRRRSDFVKICRFHFLDKSNFFEKCVGHSQSWMGGSTTQDFLDTPLKYQDAKKRLIENENWLRFQIEMGWINKKRFDAITDTIELQNFINKTIINLERKWNPL